ncbi:nuclear transport factor 2 family protein [Nocardioidaceae bacterium]|nr:nuclear transport factor 2 family protein [Nocardioidaceae bacterium]
MTHEPDTQTRTQLAALPTAIRTFVAAHTAGDTDTALATFDPGAVVVDQGESFAGTDRVRGFLTTAGSEFSYTTTLLGARPDGEDRWVVTQRLEGDFPGGVAVLDYRFAVIGDRITELTIVSAERP